MHSMTLASATRLSAALLTLTLALVGSTQAQDPGFPKTAFGAPDLQGIYSIATVTMLERPEQFAGRATISMEEAAQVGTTGESYLDDLTARPDDAAPDVGGYNTFWMDPGEQMAVLNGEVRTSIIVDPEDGRLPWAEGAQRAIFAGRANGRGPYDGPEARPMGERCLVGFGSSGGPPMLPVLYNNHSQIVQTEDYVMILAEMNHDARIIYMDGKVPANYPKWLGTSVGRYEGDSLVVETTGFHPQEGFRGSLRHFFYLSSDARVTERFTRLDENTLLYQFTVDDPQVYSRTWTGELPMNAVEDQIYEYACHEGNYALPGILAGARQQELDAQ
jgi:hypothetical protein